MTSFPEKSAAYVLPSSHKYILLDDFVCSIAGCFDEPAGHVKIKKKLSLTRVILNMPARVIGLSINTEPISLLAVSRKKFAVCKIRN